MLKIRLSRQGRKKIPFFRIVLTEHTKPISGGFKEVLGWFNPLTHEINVEIDSVKNWISKGAGLSERLAKLLYKHSKDDVFFKFVVNRERTRKTKKEDKVA